MKRARKSKGVSWAHGVYLCQVKLFSSEDCPSKVGQSPNHLQAKTSRMLPPCTVKSNDCPPGFNVTRLDNQVVDVSSIPLIKWNCPPKFVMSCHWQVAVGEESKELESQSCREMRLLEAIYPRASDIPPGATVSLEIENEPYNDSLTPLVPIIPIEEDECGVMELDSAAVENSSTSSMQAMASNILLEPAIPKSSVETSAAAAAAAGGEKPAAKLPDAGVDVAAAASAALAVLMKSMEQGSMIDTNLLIKIFNDPTMIQNLTNILPLYEAAFGGPPSATTSPLPPSKPPTELVTLPVPKPSLPNVSNQVLPSVNPTLHRPQVSNILASDVRPAILPALDPQKVKTAMSNAGAYSNTGAVPSQVNIAPVSSVRKGPQLKDLNYYKNLIKQHGDEKKDGRGQKFEHNNGNNLNMVREMKAENLKHKIQKHCIYFNTPKGCRKGGNCQYKHDMSNNWRINNVLEIQSAKRMKLWGEVAGRT